MSKPVELNGIDFLLMAQSGTLMVDIDEQGNIKGIDLDDETIERFDGMLVALHKHTQLLAESTYTVIVKDPKPNDAPELVETSEKLENIEE